MSSNLVERLLAKDTTLWSDDPQTQEKIQNRLGWLDIPKRFDDKIKDIVSFEENTSHTHVVLLGMGGSSLVSEVFLQSLDPSLIKRKFYVVDTTDAQTLKELSAALPLDRTLFIVASKSGTTLEVKSLFQYFWKLTSDPSQYIAITDENTPLHEKAKELSFSHIWINPSDIGGRFAALSYFGLIPFALMGGDLETFWKNLQENLSILQSPESPALSLAQQLFDSHNQGIHKLALQTTSSMAALPLWIEQLIAESTGKQDKGLLPIIQDHGDPAPEQSYIHVFGFEDELDEDMNVHSVSVFQSFEDLASEFYLWKMTTALTGAMLNINPFDEPHVNTTKKNTAQYLESTNPKEQIQNNIQKVASSPDDIADFITNVQPDEAICILSYLPHTTSSEQFLSELEALVSEKSDSIVMNIGPRYLHSTGQFHKGGKDIGRYIILTQNQDAPMVPDENYDFNTLKLSQALGDYEALKQAGRRVMLVHKS